MRRIALLLLSLSLCAAALTGCQEYTKSVHWIGDGNAKASAGDEDRALSETPTVSGFLNNKK